MCTVALGWAWPSCHVPCCSRFAAGGRSGKGDENSATGAGVVGVPCACGGAHPAGSTLRHCVVPPATSTSGFRNSLTAGQGSKLSEVRGVANGRGHRGSKGAAQACCASPTPLRPHYTAAPMLAMLCLQGVPRLSSRTDSWRSASWICALVLASSDPSTISSTCRFTTQEAGTLSP